MDLAAAHTGARPVADALWRQGQALAAFCPPVAPGKQASSAGDDSFGFAPFIDAAERFKAAAQTFLDGAASGSASAAAAAAQNLSDFLRVGFADARLPWDGGL